MSGKGGTSRTNESYYAHEREVERCHSCMSNKKNIQCTSSTKEHTALDNVLSKRKKYGCVDGTALCCEILCAFKQIKIETITLLRKAFREDTLHESTLGQRHRACESGWELAELQSQDGKPKMVVTKLNISTVVAMIAEDCCLSIFRKGEECQSTPPPKRNTWVVKPSLHLNVNRMRMQHVKTKWLFNVNMLPKRGKQHLTARWSFGEQPNSIHRLSVFQREFTFNTFMWDLFSALANAKQCTNVPYTMDVKKIDSYRL